MKNYKFKVWDKNKKEFLRYGEYEFHFNNNGDIQIYILFGNYYLQTNEYDLIIKLKY